MIFIFLISFLRNRLLQESQSAGMTEAISQAVKEGSREGSAIGSRTGSQSGIIGLSENRQVQQSSSF